MHLVDIFVGACFLMGVVSAALVALHPNILYAAVSLIFSLLSVAGLYGALGADFLAAVQLIIYVGGIIVVILFAVMMSENIYKGKFLEAFVRHLPAFAISLAVLFGLLKVLEKTQWQSSGELVRNNTVESIGLALVGPYALPFQYVAIVLLAGLIGAVIVARPHYSNKDKH